MKDALGYETSKLRWHADLSIKAMTSKHNDIYYLCVTWITCIYIFYADVYSLITIVWADLLDVAEDANGLFQAKKPSKGSVETRDAAWTMEMMKQSTEILEMTQ